MGLSKDPAARERQLENLRLGRHKLAQDLLGTGAAQKPSTSKAARREEPKASKARSKDDPDVIRYREENDERRPDRRPAQRREHRRAGGGFFDGLLGRL